jgi:hypothetical protein
MNGIKHCAIRPIQQLAGDHPCAGDQQERPMITFLLGWCALSVLGTFVFVGLIRADKRREVQAMENARTQFQRISFQTHLAS